MTLVLITSATPFLRLALTSPATSQWRRKHLLSPKLYQENFSTHVFSDVARMVRTQVLTIPPHAPETTSHPARMCLPTIIIPTHFISPIAALGTHVFYPNDISYLICHPIARL